MTQWLLLGQTQILLNLSNCGETSQSKRNLKDVSQVYAKINEEMHEAGYERTLTLYQDKTKQLKEDYRKVKDANKQTGNKQKKSKFFDKMNKVLHDKHSITPPVMLDTPVSISTVELSTDDWEGVPEVNKEGEFTGEAITEKYQSRKMGRPKLLLPLRRKMMQSHRLLVLRGRNQRKLTKWKRLEEKRMKLKYETLKMQQDRQ